MQILNSARILPAGLPFAEAMRHGDTLHLSGQPGTLQDAPGGIREEARQAMENIKAVLAANGLALGARVEVECIAAIAD